MIAAVVSAAVMALAFASEATLLDPKESDRWSDPGIVTMGIDDDSVTDRVGLVTIGTWSLRGQYGDLTRFIYGNPGDLPFVGDWDCDGDETPGLFRQSDGYVYLRNSNTQGIADVRFFFGNPGDVPLAGDFNGDGCDTVSIYRPSEGRVFIINTLGVADGGLGAADFNYIFGDPGDKPFVGDFNGDGIDTIGLHRESTGLVYFRQSHTQGVADNQFFFGDPGDHLVAGDWGIVDGIDTPAVFRPSNSTFYLRYTNTEGTADEAFSAGGFLPVAGDFGLVVANHPPVAFMLLTFGEAMVRAGGTLTVQGPADDATPIILRACPQTLGCSSDKDGQIVEYEWSLHPETPNTPSLSVSTNPEHELPMSMLAPGLYLIGLRVVDDGGRVGHAYAYIDRVDS